VSRSQAAHHRFAMLFVAKEGSGRRDSNLEKKAKKSYNNRSKGDVCAKAVAIFAGGGAESSSSGVDLERDATHKGVGQR